MRIKERSSRLTAVLTGIITAAAMLVPVTESLNVSAAVAPNQTSNVLEHLDRGICAVKVSSGMLVSWRWNGDDDNNATFKLYRGNELIYTSDGSKATCFLDKAGNGNSVYRVDTYSGNTLKDSQTSRLTNGNGAYFDVPLSPPGSGYTPNDMSVGDVDGDGQYELFLKWDPSNSKDNSQKGTTGNVFIDCYTLQGKRLWRIDLGQNIRAGAHYTQFYVADFDLDGKAEMTCKTSDGTKDGKGTVIGDASKNYRNSSGYILTGNEYYTLFDGATGAALHTINYEPARGDVSKWGDKYGNRVDRFWGTVAYLDGIHPCVVTGRGYYTRMTATAYKVENKKLVKMWTFDTGNDSSKPGYGDGNHNSMAADVDGDGKQEILTGSSCIDDNGTVKWCTNQGHGDAMHVADLDPSNPGLEEWICHEDKSSGYGVTLIDCDTGKQIFHNNGSGDTGRCAADNVWAKNAGAELWGNGNEVKNVKGETLSCNRPAINFFIYWDGDLEREILDGYTDSPAKISKMNDAGKLSQIFQTDGYYTCNTTKGTPCLSADIFGDWREELIVRAADAKSIRIFCTPYETNNRITTLMHDSQYRVQVSAQNTAYNQPPHPSFFLGTGYSLPARSGYKVLGGATTPTTPVEDNTPAVFAEGSAYMIKNVNSGLYIDIDGAKAQNNANAQQWGADGAGKQNTFKLVSAGDGYYYIVSAVGDGGTFVLDVAGKKTANGTNILIYTLNGSDNQKFKFVKNADGSYKIKTKISGDKSCIEVADAAKNSGANVQQWEVNGNSCQDWILESVKFEAITTQVTTAVTTTTTAVTTETTQAETRPQNQANGKYINDLVVYDNDYRAKWGISDKAENGSIIYGDRDFTLVQIPDEIKGGEMILTACDSKKFTGDVMAEFTAAEDITVYAAFDTRVDPVPAWLGAWEKTDMQITSSNDVTFNVYKKDCKANEKVTLGANGKSAYCINYTVFAKAKTAENILGDINGDKKLDLSDVVMMQKWLIKMGDITVPENADMNGDGRVNVIDLMMLKQLYIKGGQV